ncbi:MAG: signal recognition particle-docking protein FtsY, partial [Betaproteobacteria bacterium HGW-Betaproteobacteria-20]
MFNFFKKKPDQAINPVSAPATNPEQITASLVTPQTVPTPEPAIEKSQSWSERLKQSLSKTRKQLGNQLASLFGGGKIDADVYEELETILITSDVGVNATRNLLTDIKNRVKAQNLDDTVQLKAALKAA